MGPFIPSFDHSSVLSWSSLGSVTKAITAPAFAGQMPSAEGEARMGEGVGGCDSQQTEVGMEELGWEGRSWGLVTR